MDIMMCVGREEVSFLMREKLQAYPNVQNLGLMN